LLLQRRRIEHRTRFDSNRRRFDLAANMSRGPRCRTFLRSFSSSCCRGRLPPILSPPAAEQRGDLAAAYQACEANADAGDAVCQNRCFERTRPRHGAPRQCASFAWRRCRDSLQLSTIWDATTQRASGSATTRPRLPAGRGWRRNRAVRQPKTRSLFSTRRVGVSCAIPRRHLSCFGAPR
jgi:hypothetical protein